MAFTMKLNPAEAKKVGSANFIEERGEYRGVFTRAEIYKSNSGATCVEFDFKSEHGETARYLGAWISNGNGEELSGHKMVNAIMACMSLREIAAVEATITKYNNETRNEEQTRATIFPELMGKPIGLVLTREEYMPTNSNESKWKMCMVTPFDAATRCIAAEKLDRKPAEMLDKILASLKDRPLRNKPTTAGRTAAATGGGAARGSTGFDDMDDDIPF